MSTNFVLFLCYLKLYSYSLVVALRFFFPPNEKLEISYLSLLMRSEHGGAESVLSEDRRYDEPAWGSFDTHYDTDAAWDLNSDIAKVCDSYVVLVLYQLAFPVE